MLDLAIRHFLAIWRPDELSYIYEIVGDNKSNMAFELPQKVLGACWPLIVMWPVLYAGYRIEVMLGLEV